MFRFESRTLNVALGTAVAAVALLAAGCGGHDSYGEVLTHRMAAFSTGEPFSADGLRTEPVASINSSLDFEISRGAAALRAHNQGDRPEAIIACASLGMTLSERGRGPNHDYSAGVGRISVGDGYVYAASLNPIDSETQRQELDEAGTAYTTAYHDCFDSLSHLTGVLTIPRDLS